MHAEGEGKGNSMGPHRPTWREDARISPDQDSVLVTALDCTEGDKKTPVFGVLLRPGECICVTLLISLPVVLSVCRRGWFRDVLRLELGWGGAQASLPLCKPQALKVVRPLSLFITPKGEQSCWCGFLIWISQAPR